jgi:hypothetical protein
METRVSQMTVSELRQLISDVVHEQLAPLTDPDYGLELREDFVERMREQQQRIDNGERGKPFEDVVRELGFDMDEIKSGA